MYSYHDPILTEYDIPYEEYVLAYDSEYEDRERKEQVV